MKTKYFIIILLIGITKIIFAQGQYTTHTIIPNTGNKLSGLQFVNANTGFAVVYKNSQLEIAKTINKGINWSFTALPNSNGYTTASIQFVNNDTGFAYYKNFIARTTNGGNNWYPFPNLTLYPDNSYYNIIKFSSSNPNIGYHTIRYETSSSNLKIMKTSDGGNSWSQIFSQSSATYTYFIKDIAFDDENPDIVAFAGWSYNPNGGTISYANYCLFVTTNGGSNFINVEDGHASNSAFTSVQIIKKSDNSREFRMITNKVYQSTEDENSIIAETGFTSYDQSGITYRKVDNLVSGNSVYTGNGLKFLNNNTGYILSQSKIYKTTNAGNNWTLDYNIGSTDPTFSQKLSLIGNILYAGEPTGTLIIRKLNSSLNTYKDNVSITSSFGIQDVPGATGYNSYSTPTSAYILGGNISMNTNYFIGENDPDEAIFYKWSTGQATTTASSYLSTDGVFSTNYKTKNLSTDNTAISKSASVKSLREAHGNIDRIHTSIGGVFFSRSTNNGTSFGHEEVVDRIDGTAPCINPYLAEVKTGLSGGVDAAKNSSVVWEQRSGSTINIMYSQRETVGGFASWHVDQIDAVNNPNGHSFTVNVTGYPDFQCLPKLSTIKNASGSDVYYSVISYLKPDGSNTNLMARVNIPTGSPFDYPVATGNISDFAITSISTSSSVHEIHYVYKKDEHIYYKKISYGLSTPSVSVVETKISGGDGNITLRYSPDISLRNGKPVIAYQGKYTKYIIPIYNDSEEEEEQNPSLPSLPPGVNQTYYPITVRYMEDNNTWGKFYFYESDGVSSQQFPDIEGCTSANAYLLSFTKSTTQFKHFVKGDNLGEYYCSPSTFSGTDAKLVSGSYTSATGDAVRTTLSTPSNDLYTLGENTIDITNGNIQDPDNAYSNIKGVINFNSTNYVFNLGPIIVQAGEQSLFSTIEAAPAPTTAVEFNEYMKSDNFTLREGDTLIIGTDGFYKNYDGISYEAIKYTVNLVSALDDQIEMELLCDTISLGDSTAVEYYRGYIIGKIDDAEQYYVQLVTQGLNPFVDATFTVGGSYDGDDPVGDRGGQHDKTKGIYVDFGHRGGGVTPISLKPTSYSLTQNFPNPFNPTTTIRYSVPNDGLVQLKIYDISGKEVMNLVNENKVAGNYEVKFNGANLSSGIYFYRINAGEFVQTKRMVLVK